MSAVTRTMLDDDEVIYRRAHESAAPNPAFHDLQIVSISKDIETEEGVLVPSHTRGTVVGIWGQGQAFEVEFTDPVGVATVDRDDLQSVADAMN